MAGKDDPWEYLPVLNECLKILFTTGVGMLLGYFQVLDASTFVPQATKFVFYIALPLHITMGLGVGIDFYDDSFLWTFIGAFLVLRVIALVVSVIMVMCNKKKRQQGIGQVAVLWLSLTWISTVILGVPISSAVFNDPAKGRVYGILAAISSFICQLPLQLFILECHLLEREYLEKSNQKEGDEEQGKKEEEANTPPEQPLPEQAPPSTPPPEEEEPTITISVWLEWVRDGAIWRKIFFQILSNPVIWGITMGFILSLSTLGPKYLHPGSEDYIPGLGWFFITAGWFGDTVSPLSLFAMGLWMQSQGGKLFRIPPLHAALFMLSKLVLVPSAMLGLAKWFDLSDEAGRAAVLIAALPISLASFALASRYKVGEAILSENVALGTALVLPTVLVWNLVLDALDLFPIP